MKDDIIKHGSISSMSTNKPHKSPIKNQSFNKTLATMKKLHGMYYNNKKQMLTKI